MYFCKRSAFLALVFGFAAFAMRAQHPAANELVLVDEKTAPCPIVLAPKTVGHERQAAVLLAKYLSQISGKEFKIFESATPPEGRAILVGSVAGLVPAGLSDDSYAIKSDNQTLRFIGNTPMGTAFAATAFLEENLGCRFWSWDEEDIPLKPAIRIGAIDRTKKAPFKQGEIWNEEAQTNLNGFLYKSKAKPTVSFTGNHTLYPLLTPWAKEHPEAWPLNEKDGKRAPNNIHLCYMAPGMPEALAEALSKIVERNKGNVKDFIYFAGMGDWWGGMCQCEVCKKVYQEETWTRPGADANEGKEIIPASSTLLRMINRTAEILENKYPGIRVGTMAYLNLEAPPGITKPRDNVIIQVPHLRHCLAHPVDFPCKGNIGYYDNLKRWCEIAPERVYVWDYNVNFGGNFVYPFPTLGAMAENLRVYYRLGCAGVAVQGNYVSMGGDLIVAKNYVLCKVLWNPELKTDDLLEEFCKGYYGPAAEDMLSYIKLQESLAGGKDSKDFMEYVDLPLLALKPKGSVAWLGPERIADYRAKFETMLKKCASQEPWTRRVKEAKASVDAAEVWGKPVLLVEKGDRLIRSDRSDDTYDRLRELLKYTRKSSSCEYGRYLAYHQDALAQQGGPLHSIGSKNLKVKVAPVISARIYQILYNDKPLLWTPNFVNLKYPYYGGSFSRVYSGALTGGMRSADIIGKPTETKIVVEGDAGIGLWNTATQQIHTRTMEMISGDAFRITGTARRVNKVSSSAICSEVTQYQVKPGDKDPLFEIQLPGGEWQKLQFNAAENKDSAVDDEAEETKSTQKVSPAGLWRPPSKPKDLIKEVSLPKESRTIRVHLPDSNCMVEDRYLSPEMTGGVAIFNATTGVFTVIVNLSEVPVPEKGEGTWMIREMRFAPLKAAVKNKK